MSSFSDLTKLLERYPNHRLVIVREDGTPIGALIGMHEYETLLGTQRNERTTSPHPSPKRRGSKDTPLLGGEGEPARRSFGEGGGEVTTDALMGEWDALVEQVGTPPHGADTREEDTYLFEPVE